MLHRRINLLGRQTVSTTDMPSSERRRALPPTLAPADRVRVGLALRTRRLLKGEEQVTAAAGAHLGVGTLQAIETARYAVKPVNLERLAQYYGTTLAALLDEGDAGPVLERDRLTSEDLAIARAYHDATTTVRQAVVTVLRAPDPQPLSDEQRARAKTLAERLVRLSPTDFTLLLTLMAHFDQPPARQRKTVVLDTNVLTTRPDRSR